MTPEVRIWSGMLFGPLQTDQRCSCNLERKKLKSVNIVNNHMDTITIILLQQEQFHHVVAKHVLVSVKMKKLWECK